MSCYEKINYEELEMLAADGGTEKDQPMALAFTYKDKCKRFSKWLTKFFNCWKCTIERSGCQDFTPVDPPVDVQPKD